MHFPVQTKQKHGANVPVEELSEPKTRATRTYLNEQAAATLSLSLSFFMLQNLLSLRSASHPCTTAGAREQSQKAKTPLLQNLSSLHALLIFKTRVPLNLGSDKPPMSVEGTSW